ncbi:MAG: hypothetical protein VYE11_02350 [Pseudomonadota bacterium]|nr:hypothetical protein [Pseudomonadota bacterium]
MTQFIARLLSFLPGLLFLSVAYTWVTNPSKAANDLDMVYLEGLGRSTQIGDFSAFFISVSLFCIIGSIFKNTSFLFSAIIILSSAAIMRIVSWQLYEADFSGFSIGVEIISSIMILLSIILIKKNSKHHVTNEVDENIEES